MNKAIRMGIAGMTSDHVWRMAQNLTALPTVELVGGAEPYEELRQQAQERFHLQTVYQAYGEMLEKEDLDAILACGDSVGEADIVSHSPGLAVPYRQARALSLIMGGVGNG